MQVDADFLWTVHRTILGGVSFTGDTLPLTLNDCPPAVGAYYAMALATAFALGGRLPPVPIGLPTEEARRIWDVVRGLVPQDLHAERLRDWRRHPPLDCANPGGHPDRCYCTRPSLRP